ncbi:hypothetical protein R3P38DRAFT_2857546 [Favolaschia claudopus]|uniref:F-box domain-containing protein n=1 Tax=Favolaschia claudopus TaxID=2862362 RepID=A0AAW0DG94_9AGAR
MAHRYTDSRNASLQIAPSRTSDATLAEQISALQAQLDAVRAKQQVLEAKRTSLYHEFTTVVVQEAGCRKAIATLEQELRMALAKIPHIISRLLPEILSEIFRWTLLSEEDYMRRVNGRDVLVAPWRLCRVNGHWRAVARADPHLWSRIVINCENIRQGGYLRRCIPPLEYPLAALETQLSLSRAGSISVECHLHEWADSESNRHSQHLADLLNLLIAESHRWVRLSIGTLSRYPETSVFNLLSKVHGRLDLLRHLQINNWGSNVPSSWPLSLRDAFAVAPNLQEVLLPEFLRIHRHSSYISLDYPRLTTLRITLEEELALELLSAMQNLTDLELEVPGLYPRESVVGSESNLITLPRLRRIELGWFTDTTRYLSTPKLESLQLGYCIQHVPAFIRRSACQLQSLEITSISENEGGLAAVIGILQLSPDLSHLELSFDNSASVSSEAEYLDLVTRLLPALTLSHASPNICAKLTTFELSSCEKIPRSFGDALCGMLESRWNMPINQRFLRCVRMPGASHEIAIWERLDALRLDGLDIGPFWKASSSDDDESEDGY